MTQVLSSMIIQTRSIILSVNLPSFSYASDLISGRDCIANQLQDHYLYEYFCMFLLVKAKGVISEKGSLLSHTAIISRELKIPSVVGVEALMDTIKTGDIVRMNGSTGEIEIIKR